MLFKDRSDAGRKLAQKLLPYSHMENTLVVGLMRGGVVTAYEVASLLHLKLSALAPRKIGAPFNPELAIGAICEEESVINEELVEILGVSPAYVQQEIQEQKKEAERRKILYQRSKSPPKFFQQTVIVVDDGIATGQTMLATIRWLKKQKAKKIIVAVPVSSKEAAGLLEKETDELVSLYILEHFFAVGQFYENFSQTSDEEATHLLAKEIS